MYAVAYRKTMAGARPKIVVAPPAPEPVNLVEIRRQKLERECNALRRARQAEELKLEQCRAEAARTITLANEALRTLHEQWAIEQKRQNQNTRAYRLVKNPVSIEEVVRRICKAVKCRPSDVLNDRRHKAMMLIRQAIFYWAARRTGKSLSQIGRYMDRDHTTILHGKNVYVQKRKAMGRTLREVL